MNYIFAGFILYETTFTSSGIPGWNVTNGNINYCSLNNLFSGQTTLQKTISNLSSHYKFEFNIILVGFNGFNGNTLNVYFDGLIQGTFNFPMITTNYQGIMYQPPFFGEFNDDFWNF